FADLALLASDNGVQFSVKTAFGPEPGLASPKAGPLAIWRRRLVPDGHHDAGAGSVMGFLGRRCSNRFGFDDVYGTRGRDPGVDLLFDSARACIHEDLDLQRFWHLARL